MFSILSADVLLLAQVYNVVEKTHRGEALLAWSYKKQFWYDFNIMQFLSDVIRGRKGKADNPRGLPALDSPSKSPLLSGGFRSPIVTPSACPQ